MEPWIPVLLCYGHDDILLYTRKCILEREYSVKLCNGLACLREILAQGPVQVVVLCHSVPEAECEEVIELSRTASPQVKILALQEAIQRECFLHSDRTMDAMEGPPALLFKIHSMLISSSAENAPLG